MTNATRYLAHRAALLAATLRRAVKDCLVLVLVIALYGNVALAQQEEVQVTIVPRVRPVAARVVAAEGGAQQPAAPSAQGQQPSSPQAPGVLILPPGTTLPLGLVRPLALKPSSARGAGVYLQVTFPVSSGGRMVVPPGAYVQGFIEKMRWNRGANPDLVLEMRSADLIFSTGYTVPIRGAFQVVHTNARLMPPPASGTQDQPAVAVAPGPVNQPAPAMTAVGITPPDLPPLPKPSLGNGPRNAMIAVGAVAGAVVIGMTVAALHRRNDVYLATGTPLEITLAAPLVLDSSSVASAVQQYTAQAAVAPPQIVRPPGTPDVCYDPGTPGTPDTVIPGTPPTPDTVIPGVNGMPDTLIPGSPGTPDTVVPGTPGTPGSWGPCSQGWGTHLGPK